MELEFSIGTLRYDEGKDRWLPTKSGLFHPEFIKEFNGFWDTLRGRSPMYGSVVADKATQLADIFGGTLRVTDGSSRFVIPDIVIGDQE